MANSDDDTGGTLDLAVEPTCLDYNPGSGQLKFSVFHWALSPQQQVLVGLVFEA